MGATLFYIILPVGGFCFIILSLIFKKSLGDKEVINLQLSKWGLILKANAFGLLIIVGFALIVGTVTYLYRGYGKLRSQEEIVEDFMDGFDEMFSQIDMEFKLIFPTPAPPNPKEDTTSIAVWIRHKGEQYQLYEKSYCDARDQSIILTVQDLRINDCIYVEVKGDVPYEDQDGEIKFVTTKFASDDVRIPVFHINMEERP